ncbi:MAG: transcriptional repressor LexA [Anaerolineae bacterium]
MLSPRQSTIMDVIEDSVRERGYPPTVRELCQATGISSTSVVSYNLHRLEEMGYIHRNRDTSRGIQLAERPDRAGDGSRRSDALRQVPLLGRIAAGEPLAIPDAAALADSAAMLSIAAEWLPRVSNLYALQVRGDSMIDALIGDGDIIVVDRDAEAMPGDTAVVWLRDRRETTLKRVYPEGPTVRLVPANPTMQPFVVPAADVDIQGRVVLVIRRPHQPS